MCLRVANILLIISTMLQLTIADPRISACSIQRRRNLKMHNQEEILNTALGFPFQIVLNSVRGEFYIHRGIFLLIEAEYFTRENIEKVVRKLATEFSQPQELKITAFSDKEMLQRAINNFKHPYAIDFTDTPAGREAARRWAELNDPLKRGYFRAYFWRHNNGEEILQYSPDPEKEDYITITLKSRLPPAYTGHISSDLVLALEDGDKSKAKALLARGADANARSKDGETVLMIAAANGHLDLVKELISAGADVNAKGPDGYTALMYALSGDQEEIVQILLENGADVNAKTGSGLTVLILAASLRKSDLVKYLLAKGADPNAETSYGETALMMASANNLADAVKALLTAGANVNAKNADGETALMLAGNSLDVLQALLDQGADINAQDKNGWTALMYAARFGHSVKAKFLINSGAIINIKAKDGLTARMIAERFSHKDIAELVKEVEAK